MTLLERLRELGNDFPVKLGFRTAFIYAGNTYEEIDVLLDNLWQKEKERCETALSDNINHRDGFDDYWNKIIKSETDKLEYDMDYPARVAECKVQCEELNEKIEYYYKNIAELEKEDQDDSVIKDIRYNQRMIANCRKEISNRKAYIDKHDGVEMPEDVKENKRAELVEDIERKKKADWKRTNARIKEFEAELKRLRFCDREIREEYGTIAPWEDSRTRIILCKGLVDGKYWDVDEMNRDDSMKELIEWSKGKKNAC